MWIILNGLDPGNELKADGDPGPFLKKVAEKNTIDWKNIFPKPGQVMKNPVTIPGSKIIAEQAFLEIAHLVGYQGDGLGDFPAYLNSLPETIPDNKE